MKKYYFFVALLILFFFENPTCAQITSGTQSIDSGIELFNSGQIQKSYDLFLNLLDEHPDNITLNFYLGRTAFELGYYEMSIMAYERVLIVSPSENRVKLEIARSFHAMGANNTARQYCYEVLDTQPPETVKDNINRFLAAIDKSEQTHFLNGQISLGVDWNDNVWATPTTTTISTVIGNIDLSGASSKKTRDWVYNATFGLNHKYRPVASHFSWDTGATFYKAVNKDTSALDLQYAGGTTGPEWQRGNVRYAVKVLLSHIDLGSTEYMNSAGIAAWIDYAFTPSVLGQTGYRFESKEFPGNSTRDAKTQTLFFDLGFPVSTARCSIGLQLQKEKASDDEYGYKRIQSSLSISNEFWLKIMATGRYGFQFSKYDEPSNLFTRKREDHQHTVGAGLNKRVWQSGSNQNYFIDMDVNYQHSWAFSNLDLYDYKQHLIQIFFTYHF